MRTDLIHSVEYLFPIVKDDYGNDIHLAFVNTTNTPGYSPFCGYMAMATNIEKWSNCYAHVEEAFWKGLDRELTKFEKGGFYIEEYKHGTHTLEGNKTQGLVTRFYIRKDNK